MKAVVNTVKSNTYATALPKRSNAQAAMLRTDIGGYVSPVGCRSLPVGMSCWLFVVAGGGSWWWWVVSAVSFVADYAWRSPHTAVVDRCIATVAACMTLPRAHPGAVVVAAMCAVASRSATTTTHWVVAHTCWHVAAAACIASAETSQRRRWSLPLPLPPYR